MKLHAPPPPVKTCEEREILLHCFVQNLFCAGMQILDSHQILATLELHQHGHDLSEHDLAVPSIVEA